MNHYLESLDVLEPKSGDIANYLVLDLFAGCGGLSLGFESIGFKTIGYESKKDAVDTYNKNLNGNCHLELLTPDFNFPNADVIIGGPPCQPFSVGGKQMGLKDSRDGFPIFINAVRKVQPKIFMFENVRGMLYKNREYLDEILIELESLGYKLTYELLNAKHFGVPQNRERFIVWGHKDTLLLPKRHKQIYTAGDALSDIAFKVNADDIFLTPSQDKYVAKYEKASKCINPRDLNFKKPARTLTCRNLAGATGDMHRIKLPDGRRKRLSIREGARLQSFPDWFEFCGTKSTIYEQIGNAVAPLFARSLAFTIANYLLGDFPQEVERVNIQRSLFEVNHQ
ncbi:DNA cytosine methyltransferase [Methylophilaceae bacterium]|nr:DNA cytosine methyltransferase [Methylophilaceae bacterium]